MPTKDGNPTIEVEGYFGPKQTTKEEFVQYWTDHCNDFIYLVDYMIETDMDWYKSLKAQVSERAGLQFARKLKEQTK